MLCRSLVRNIFDEIPSLIVTSFRNDVHKKGVLNLKTTA
jgi:hypothetical protein